MQALVRKRKARSTLLRVIRGMWDVKIKINVKEINNTPKNGRSF